MEKIYKKISPEYFTVENSTTKQKKVEQHGGYIHIFLGFMYYMYVYKCHVKEIKKLWWNFRMIYYSFCLVHIFIINFYIFIFLLL